MWGTLRMLFPLVRNIDIWQFSGFGMAHFIHRPILEDLIGRSIYRVLYNNVGRFWFCQTLPGNQVYTNKQAKKQRADQRQLDTPE